MSEALLRTSAQVEQNPRLAPVSDALRLNAVRQLLKQPLRLPGVSLR